jgi:hypothetical protein
VVEAVEAVEPVEAVEAVEPVEPVEPVEAVEAVDALRRAEARGDGAGDVAVVEPVEPVEAVEAVEAANPSADVSVDAVAAVVGDDAERDAEGREATEGPDTMLAPAGL